MTDTASGDQPFVSEVGLPLKQPSDAEALNLVVAFYCIMEPERRAEVLALAERYAGELAQRTLLD